MNRLSTTMITQVKEIMLKGPSNALDREPLLHNRKKVAEIKDMEWNSESKVSVLMIYL